MAEAKAAKAGADLEAACLAAIAEMSGSDRELAETLHELVKKHTALAAKTWYGMPAYTNADGKVVVFFQSAAKFKVRYATIGFQEAANLDEGQLLAECVCRYQADRRRQEAASGAAEEGRQLVETEEAAKVATPSPADTSRPDGASSR